MNRPQFQWGSLIILPLLLPCVSTGLWRGVRCEVSGGLYKATQFRKVEKSIRKTWECCCIPPACWSNAVHTDFRASGPACDSKWRNWYNYEIHPIHPFNIDKQNPAQMFHWFYLPNISCRNINLMGTNIYPVVPVEIKPREDRILHRAYLRIDGWSLGFQEQSKLFFSSPFLPFFSFHVTWLIESIFHGIQLIMVH